MAVFAGDKQWRLAISVSFIDVHLQFYSRVLALALALAQIENQDFYHFIMAVLAGEMQWRIAILLQRQRKHEFNISSSSSRKQEEMNESQADNEIK